MEGGQINSIAEESEVEMYMHLVREWEGLWMFIKNWNAGLDPSGDAHAAQKHPPSFSLHLPLLWEPSETPITEEITHTHTHTRLDTQLARRIWITDIQLLFSLIVFLFTHIQIHFCNTHSSAVSQGPFNCSPSRFYLFHLSMKRTHTHTHTHTRGLWGVCNTLQLELICMRE